MPTKATIEYMDSFWAGYVGFPPELLETSGTHAVPFQNPDHRGIHVFRRGGLCLVSTTRERLEEVSRISGEPPDRVFDEQFLTKAFPTITKITGPNLLFMCDRGDFRPSDIQACRKLTSGDSAAVESLKAASPAVEWEYSGLDEEDDEAFGCFLGDTIVAAGRLHDLRGQVLSLGLLTHPDFRRQGYGRAVASAMTDYGLNTGRVMFYRSLLANHPSVEIATALGYQEYGRTLFIRLLPSEAEQRDLIRRAGVGPLTGGVG